MSTNDVTEIGILTGKQGKEAKMLDYRICKLFMTEHLAYGFSLHLSGCT